MKFNYNGHVTYVDEYRMRTNDTTDTADYYDKEKVGELIKDYNFLVDMINMLRQMGMLNH